MLTPDSLRILLGCRLGVAARIGPAEMFGFDPDAADPGIRFELTDSTVAHRSAGSQTRSRATDKYPDR